MNAFSKSQPVLEILLLEDNLDDAMLVELELQRAGMHCRLQHVTGEKGFLAALKNYAPDVILSDFLLPQYDGHAALRDAAQMSPGTPVIIVTGSISEETAVKCMQQGAADYVLKPNLVRLAPAIRAALERRQVRVEKQLAEKALRESERRFRNLADTTPMLIWMCGSDARFTYLNQPWLDFTGRTREQELGDGWAEGLHREDLVPVTSLFHSALTRREAFKVEYRLRRADGTYRWMLAHGTPRFFNGGVFAGFVGSSVDITERKQVEKALRDSDARKSAIFNAALDCIITLDYEGRIVECNPAAEVVFGLERGEVLGKFMADCMIPPDLRTAFRGSLEQYPAGGEPELLGRREEFAALRGDGTEFQVEMTMTRIEMEGPPMFTVYLRDITERRQHEREREQLIRELQDALAKVKTLSGLVPVCASCKKIRDDDGRWNQMEVYIKQRTNADFTHGYCPDCARRVRETFGKFAPAAVKA